MHHSTAWIVSPEITVSSARGGASVPTPTGALRSLGHFVTRLSDRLRDAGAIEGTVLVTDDAYALLGLAETAPEGGMTAAVGTLERTGWKSHHYGEWWTFRSGPRPAVHLGRVDYLDSLTAEEFPFAATWWSDTVQGFEAWQHATGVAWQQDVPVMGIELVHKTLRPWRKEGVKGNLPVVKHDDRSPASADEPTWTPQLWTRKPPKNLPFSHAYDRYRAEIGRAHV